MRHAGVVGLPLGGATVYQETMGETILEHLRTSLVASRSHDVVPVPSTERSPRETDLQSAIKP